MRVSMQCFGILLAAKIYTRLAAKIDCLHGSRCEGDAHMVTTLTYLFKTEAVGCGAGLLPTR